MKMHRFLPILPVVLSIGSLLLSVPSTAGAQGAFARIRPGPLGASGPAPLTFERTAPERQDTTHRKIPSSYWAEGALIGGGAGGLLVGVTVLALCDFGEGGNPPNCIAAGNAGVTSGLVLLGVPAALIGGAFKKSAPAPGSVRRGNKGTLGALAFGIPSAIITISGVDYYCGRDHLIYRTDRCSAGNILGAVLVGAANTGIGYLLGRAIPKWGPPPAR